MVSSEGDQVAEEDIGEMVTEKVDELKGMLKDLHASVEEWKFGIEQNKEGTKIEVRLVAMIKRKKPMD
jgi:hypothetical protein